MSRIEVTKRRFVLVPVLLVAGVAVVLSLWSARAGTTHYVAEVLIERSGSLQKQRQYAAARRAAISATQLDPTNGYGWYLAGLNALFTQDYAGARDNLSRAIPTIPHLPNVHKSLGQALFELNQWAESAQTLLEYFAMDPAPAAGQGDYLRHLLGNALYRAQRNGRGAIELSKSAMSPRYTKDDMRTSMLNSLLLNQLTMTDFFLQRLQRLDSSARIDTRELLTVASSTQRMTTMRSFLELLWLRGQFDPDVLKVLALTYIREGKFDDAVTVLYEAERRSAADPEIPLLLGDAYLRKGDRGLAQSFYEKHLRMKPDSKMREDISKRLQMPLPTTQTPAP